MNIVLIGKQGQLGWEFRHTLHGAGNVIALGREDLDVANLAVLQKKIAELQPALIINTTAYTDVDLAEKHHELATNINAQAPGAMAEIARKLKSVFIHYSTDYVFDGNRSTPYTENSPTNPLNIYGQTKLQGEANIAQVGGAYLIFRTSWVYSLRRSSFVTKVLEWSRKNKTLKIVTDQISGPTWAHALAATTSALITKNSADLFNTINSRQGIYHLAGSGYTSRYEWAKRILAHDPQPTEQLVQTIEPVLSLEFPTPAKRPSFSALNCDKFTQTFDLRLPEWEASLQTAMTEPHRGEPA